MLGLRQRTTQNEVFLLGSGSGCAGRRAAGEPRIHGQVPEVPRTDTAGAKEHPAQHYPCAHRRPGCGAG